MSELAHKDKIDLIGQNKPINIKIDSKNLPYMSE